MARAGSTTTSRRKASPAVAAAEAAADGMVEAATTDSPAGSVEVSTAPESITEVEETVSMSTDTVEAPAEEAVVSDTTESVDEAAEKAAAEAEIKANHQAFTEAVATSLEARDTSTGNLPVVNIEPVQAAYRKISGSKNKNAAKKHLTKLLQDAINSSDIQLGMAIMQLSQVIDSTASAPKPQAERKPVDPTGKFVDELAVLNLAYLLRRADVPEGVETDGDEGAFTKAEKLVGELTEQAETYYAWVKSTAEDKGDEPEVSSVVKRAVKAAHLKSAGSAKSAGTSTPRVTGGPRRSVRTHIAQAFGDKESGTVLRVAEISNAKTEEYPDGDCSPGAISAALKSEKGVEGFEKTLDGNGNLAARKL